MTRFSRITLALAAVLAVAAAAALPAVAGQPKGPSAEEVTKIKAACAELKVRAKPEKPRRRSRTARRRPS